MGYTGKVIVLSKHALAYMPERGFNEMEVQAASALGEWVPGERGKLECRMDIPFGGEWNGKFYQTRQIRPIFADDHDAVVVITVYTYYF